MNDSEHLSHPPETPGDGNEPTQKPKVTSGEIMIVALLAVLGLVVPLIVFANNYMRSKAPSNLVLCLLPTAGMIVLCFYLVRRYGFSGVGVGLVVAGIFMLCFGLCVGLVVS